ncbi:MAG TPA: SGNH/GDSL hydrolase family protein [Chitinophagaceae bacterium]|nr:SGNH/GDSL hydrolase family protein [Chitinophagaceae bacterium]
MADPSHTYLALGDSYTIGEGVPLHESFPYQAVQMLRKAGKRFHAPEIIAKTGWTTDELSAAIAQTALQPTYDLVTLLIGVNNQYRGRSIEEYAVQFDELLQQAITFAGNQPGHVVVLSIPDWGATPFAADRDPQKIATAIDAFNMINKTISNNYKVHYLDITPGTRTSASDESMLAPDKLHPSGKEYKRWAENLATTVGGTFN